MHGFGAADIYSVEYIVSLCVVCTQQHWSVGCNAVGCGGKCHVVAVSCAHHRHLRILSESGDYLLLTHSEREAECVPHLRLEGAVQADAHAVLVGLDCSWFVLVQSEKGGSCETKVVNLEPSLRRSSFRSYADAQGCGRVCYVEVNAECLKRVGIANAGCAQLIGEVCFLFAGKHILLAQTHGVAAVAGLHIYAQGVVARGHIAERLIDNRSLGCGTVPHAEDICAVAGCRVAVAATSVHSVPGGVALHRPTLRCTAAECAAVFLETGVGDHRGAVIGGDLCRE